MPYSNFPGGFAEGVTIRGVPITTMNTGKVFWVYNGTALQGGQRGGADGNKGTYDSPFSTIDYAIGQCVANRGDIIMVKAGHAETLASASAITVDVAGISIIGLGAGASRPTLTFSATTSTMVISAASVTVQNIITKPSIDNVVSPIVVSGADCWLDYEHQDESSAIEAIRAILTEATANRLHVDLVYRGFTAGNAVVNAVRLVGCDDGDINVDFYGVASTAVVEFVTTACTNVKVKGTFYNSGTTDGSKDVIDTVTGSTWSGDVFDASAGRRYSGGSASAWASDDVSTVAANQTVPTADSTANVLERDVVGNKTDAAVTAVGTTKSILAYVKGLVTMSTVQTADSTANAFAGDAVGNKTDAGVTAVGTTKSILAYVKGLVTMNTVQSADATNNAFAGDVVGNKTDASIYYPGTTKSVAAYVKGAADLQECVVTNTTAALVNGTTIFTIAGGPIEILSLVARCVTVNDATASTLQWSADPTDGAAATFSAASASLANAAAGAMVILQGTTLATAPIVNATGVGLGQGTTNGIVVGAGIITTTVGTGSTTGTWQHHMRYRPLARGVTVS